MRRNRVADRLGHFFALSIDRKSMRQQIFIRRAAIHRATDQKRRMKPAAMLVRAFEIHVGLRRFAVGHGLLQ